MRVDKVQTFDRRLLTRRCVACGYDGALLRDGQATQCVRCGCDLTQRPARSYAEMEGLLDQPAADLAADAAAPDEGLIHKWLAFLFCVTLLLIALGYLVSSIRAI